MYQAITSKGGRYKFLALSCLAWSLSVAPAFAVRGDFFAATSAETTTDAAMRMNLIGQGAGLRTKIRNVLVAAQGLSLATPPDFKGALVMIQDLDKSLTDKTKREDYTIAKFIGFLAINLGDTGLAQSAYNRALGTDAAPEKEMPAILSAALLLNFQNNDYAKTIDNAVRLQHRGKLDDKSLVAFAQAYYFTGDYAAAARVVGEGVAQMKGEGKTPSDDLIETHKKAQARAVNPPAP